MSVYSHVLLKPSSALLGLPVALPSLPRRGPTAASGAAGGEQPSSGAASPRPQWHVALPAAPVVSLHDRSAWLRSVPMLATDAVLAPPPECAAADQSSTSAAAQPPCAPMRDLATLGAPLEPAAVQALQDPCVDVPPLLGHVLMRVVPP
jgi:hypothetical protein